MQVPERLSVQVAHEGCPRLQHPDYSVHLDPSFIAHVIAPNLGSTRRTSAPATGMPVYAFDLWNLPVCLDPVASIKEMSQEYSLDLFQCHSGLQASPITWRWKQNGSCPRFLPTCSSSIKANRHANVPYSRTILLSMMQSAFLERVSLLIQRLHPPPNTLFTSDRRKRLAPVSIIRQKIAKISIILYRASLIRNATRSL
jgi:hypothetical protein